MNDCLARGCDPIDDRAFTLRLKEAEGNERLKIHISGAKTTVRGGIPIGVVEKSGPSSIERLARRGSAEYPPRRRRKDDRGGAVSFSACAAHAYRPGSLILSGTVYQVPDCSARCFGSVLTPTEQGVRQSPKHLRTYSEILERGIATTLQIGASCADPMWRKHALAH